MPPTKKSAPPKAPAPRQQSAEEAHGDAFLPVDGAVSRGFVPTKAEACPPFLLVHNPERWTVMAGQVIPQFGKMPLVPGLNGADVHRAPNGQMRTLAGAAKNNWEERGCTLIPPNAIPDHHQRGAVKSYLWQPKGRPDCTLLIYTKCYPGSDVLETDVAAYLEFCQHLVDTGVIAPCPVYVLRRMVDKQRARVEKLTDKVASMPSLKPQLEAAIREMEALEAALTERAADAMVPSEGEGVGVDA